MGGLKTVNEWLNWQQNLHHLAIDLGLDRIKKVYQNLFPNGVDFKVISIAGTNGKGSTAAFIDNIYAKAKVKCGKFTSPHLLNYNERFTISGVAATEPQICQAFAAIEAQRNGISLSYFEFSTLAALLIFSSQKVAVAILEVGLGGRLDSVNMVDNDVSVITNIALDHTEYLGASRSQIGYEKAGIMRPNTPCFCADNKPPKSLQKTADNIGALLSFVRFPYTDKIGLQGEHQQFNAALAVAAVGALEAFTVTDEHIKAGIKNTKLTGRFEQRTINQKTVILDTAHNPAAVDALAKTLAQNQQNKPQTIAIFAALKDKNISLMIDKIASLIDCWFLVPLATDRAIKTNALKQKFKLNSKVFIYQSMNKAIDDAVFNHPNQQVVIFGSFHTVAAAVKLLDKK